MSSGETGAADTTSAASGDTPTGTGGPSDGLVLCPFELSQVVAAPRQVEPRFTDAELAFTGPMAWSGGQLLVAFKIATAEDEPRRWAIGASGDATATLASQWDLPPEAYPAVIVDTPDGVLVVADAWSSDHTGGLLRLGADAGHDVLVETPYSGESFDAAHPLASVDGRIYARMFETTLGYQGRAVRLPIAGGAVEVFDYLADLYAVVGAELIGVNSNFIAPGCEPDCLAILASLRLTRHSVASGQTTVIADPICITGNADYVPSVTGGRGVRPVGVTPDGLIVDEGALVQIGFDGSHRVIAAVEDGIDRAVAHAGSIYFVSGATFSSEDLLRLRRVPIAGGVVEELATFADSDDLTITAVSDAHVYLIHEDDETRAVVRVSL